MASGTTTASRQSEPSVAELFAGVGGFNLGLSRAGFRVVWSNQWEPSTSRQHAFACLEANIERGRLAPHEAVNRDIEDVLDEYEAGNRHIPRVDMVVGGFPCQDYSVARTLAQATGIQGRKGVLWWQIHRLIGGMRPPLILLENVDRLLSSPANQRGRDFAIMLASLADLGYGVEWRVVNAADYGFPQRRRRVFILATRDLAVLNPPEEALSKTGVLARAFPANSSMDQLELPLQLDGDLAEITERFNSRGTKSPFKRAGVMLRRNVWTNDVSARYEHLATTEPDWASVLAHRGIEGCTDPHWLIDVLQPDAEVPGDYFLRGADEIQAWFELKRDKKVPRTDPRTGHTYHYSEGSIAFPDHLFRPSRTILTGEGGRTPSRFKHLVVSAEGRWRRLTPLELERLNGFPDGWTNTGMSDGRRGFMMGNALVVGVVGRIGQVLIGDLQHERTWPSP